MEELAAVDLGPAIFVSVHAMVCGLIAKFGSSAQCAEILPPLAAGKQLAAFALTEPSAGSDAGSLKTEAMPHGDGYILRGEKCYITSAGYADLYLVFARTAPGGSAGVTAFLVPANSTGLTISPPEKKMGCELSPIASLSLDGVTVPSSAVLGELHGGFKVAMGGLAGGRVSIAACANGLARSALERATAHLKEREQFGKKLAEFQGLQFMLADMRMKLEAAQLLTWQAAHEIDADPSRRQIRLYASAAKCFATDAAMSITTDAVQLFGGAGYIREYQVERLMRDAKMLQIVEGANQLQRELIAREMLR
jgi:alkylation response protein AidB-like acyl-CoA dehydrogenase